MKITADDGTEYRPTTRTEAYRVVRMLITQVRSGPDRGPKPGRHVNKTPWGTYRYRYVSDGKQHNGPPRATPEEAAEDYRRVLAGLELAPRNVGLGTQSHSERCRVAHLAAVARMKAASPDGQIHLKPATCRGCGQQGHKSNVCPAKGWKPPAPKVTRPYARRTPRAARCCGFCAIVGHNAQRCAKRLQALRERVRRAA